VKARTFMYNSGGQAGVASHCIKIKPLVLVQLERLRYSLTPACELWLGNC